MPDTPNLGESAYWIMTASALLIRRAKYGSEEYTAASQALTSLMRLQDEIRDLNERLERRAVAVDPAAVTSVVPVDQSRARPAPRRPVSATGPFPGSLPSEDRVGGSPT